jgi:hypothetical protein
MDFYIFHREPVGLLGVFFGLGFFSLQPSIGEICVYFWDLVSSEFGCVGIDTILGILGVILDLYFFFVLFWFHFRTLSFFSVIPLGL